MPRHKQLAWYLVLIGMAAAQMGGCSQQAGVVAEDDGTSASSAANTGSSSAAGGTGGSSEMGGGGSGAGYIPDPIPEIDPEPPAPCPAQTPSGYFQFLDDTCGAKQQPSDSDRELACPSLDLNSEVTLTGGGRVSYLPSSAPVTVSDELASLVPAGMMITVILIRRVNGIPHYRYLSNGSHDQAYQPWSTTKFLAAANAATYLRIQSNYLVGLSASVDGYPLGDLVTSIHNYDYDPFSSNGLGRYFHDIGQRNRANDMIHAGWLGRPAGETFGGNYGVASPPLGFSFVEPSNNTVTINPDNSSGPANHLSSLTMAEALKRLVLHREEPDQRLPGIQWTDVKTLLYGADGSAKYGPWGGMTRDTAIYLQTGHDIDYLESRSHGQWRIFSKLGLGTGGQFLNVGYGCFPVLDDDGNPAIGWGRELVVAAHLPSGGASWAERDRLLAASYRAILTRVVDGRL